MSEKPDMQVEDLSAVASAKAEGKASYSTALPEQKAFFRIPARFGHVPVAEEPLGYDHERRFEQHYPRIELPFQLVDTIDTGVKRQYLEFGYRECDFMRDKWADLHFSSFML